MHARVSRLVAAVRYQHSAAWRRLAVHTQKDKRLAEPLQPSGGAADAGGRPRAPLRWLDGRTVTCLRVSSLRACSFPPERLHCKNRSSDSSAPSAFHATFARSECHPQLTQDSHAIRYPSTSSYASSCSAPASLRCAVPTRERGDAQCVVCAGSTRPSRRSRPKKAAPHRTTSVTPT